MKTSLFSTCGILLIAATLLTNCKKESTLINASAIDAASINLTNKAGGNSCRLAFLAWGNAFTWQFNYNEMGLVDKWIIDYGDGSPTEETLVYDNNYKLIQANELYYGTKYTYLFYYTSNRVTKISRTNVDFPEDHQNTKLTYNSKGQMIKQDDNENGTHVRMLYDDMDNCTRTDLYFGNDLYFSDIYTFSSPVSNPCNTLAGINFGFPFYGTAGVGNKQWFTSNRGIIYDNGTPTVLYKYDPSKTVIQTGDNNFPVTASYYDKITKSTEYYTFSYDNCNGKSDKATTGNVQVPSNIINNKTTGLIRPMLFRGSQKSIKEQIQKLKMSNGNQLIK